MKQQLFYYFIIFPASHMHRYINRSFLIGIFSLAISLQHSWMHTLCLCRYWYFFSLQTHLKWSIHRFFSCSIHCTFATCRIAHLFLTNHHPKKKNELMNKSTKMKSTNALRRFQPENKNLKLWSTIHIFLLVLIRVKQALLLQLSLRINKHITITKNSVLEHHKEKTY